MMIKRNLLTTSTAVNYVMKALVDIGDFGAIFTFYRNTVEANWATPNMDTYHLVLDAVLKNPHRRASLKAVAIITQALQGQHVEPDAELLHKLVQCCKSCDECRQLEPIAELLHKSGIEVQALLQDEVIPDIV